MKTANGLPSAGFSQTDHVRSNNYSGRGSTSRNSNGVYQGNANPRNSEVGGNNSTRGGFKSSQNGENFDRPRYGVENGRTSGNSASRNSRGRGRAAGLNNGTYQGQVKPKTTQV